MCISFGLVVYWRLKRRFTGAVFAFSLIAYFAAIAIKYLLQALTLNSYTGLTHSNPFALGAYYGSQTVVFEVLGAYLVARYAATHGKLMPADAAAYGIGLALWENGVLISIPLLINYVAYYALLSSPASHMEVYTVLNTHYPTLFLPPLQALPLVGLAVLERISSIMLHLSWGYLVVLAATKGRKLCLYAALPMGLADFLVPFANVLGLPLFELSLFIIASASLVLAAFLGSKTKTKGNASPEYGEAYTPTSALTLGIINFKRALSYSKVYVATAIALSLLLTAEFTLFTRRSGMTLAAIYPLIAPLSVVVGSVGGLWLFTSDKGKGVYEYLIASGVDVSTIYTSTLVSTVALATLVLGSSMAIMAAAFAVAGIHVTSGLLETLLLYTLPLSYSSPIFMSVAGMTWSTLTTRVTGVNSPVGVAPILGIAPVLSATVLSAIAGPRFSGYVAILVSAAVIVLTAVTSVVADRKMARERFLSNE